MQASGQSANELGRLLAGAQGYTVFTHEGAVLGALERVRYETQVSRPDDIVVSGRRLFRRRRCTIPFELVSAVSAREGKVLLRPDVL
jgi:sporulation protein YlmC with PRC-barrel domain